MAFSLFKKLVLLAISTSPALAQTITGATQCIPAGQYTLCQNLWGANSGTGSQSSTLISASGSSVSWSTNWNWQNNPNNVKSYANVQSNSALGVQLNNIASAPSTFDWTYQSQSSGIRADVSYDIWLGSASSGNPASSASSYEIMIWLSGLGGIQPVGSQIQTGINLAGHTWTLWSGPNSNWRVFSFVSASGNINNFSADLNPFFQYLIKNQGVSGSQYVQSIQAGTEPFTGSANLVINSYSVAINKGTPSSTASGGNPTGNPSSGSGSVAQYGQCGGTGYSGPTACASPYTCTYSNPYYSQCL
ncbi:Xyloglucan-specific endo-beta-1,4-glucanase A [Psilocybe cubensis]|uniref:Xyloglucan-specific endo-beta-1,4-glucanase A n=1 Tax=Psilocybe cubensis TaxID=181762 RepID=A0ACB8H6U1_PSICU|nr:Xyloglucan-specific endo-beta-1,4-glucanase A [Psilocybe cubensis]KAH9483357.1 Xyloglucan-specific endo-beta-1,4-glucanase A [Psilocybe cubensis]